jgi:DNA polymerase-4
VGRTFTLRLRFDDFSRATRSATIPRTTAATAAWLDTGRRLLAAAWPLVDERGCTLLGVTISGLVEVHADEQLELPLLDLADRSQRLDGVLDGLRDRFGAASVTRGTLVGRHPGIEMPTLPDPPR